MARGPALDLDGHERKNEPGVSGLFKGLYTGIMKLLSQEEDEEHCKSQLPSVLSQTIHV